MNLKELVIDHRYPEDIKRIMKAGIDVDIILSPKAADKIWREYSDMLCAGWLILPQDDETIGEVILAAREAILEEIIFWEGDE